MGTWRGRSSFLCVFFLSWHAPLCTLGANSRINGNGAMVSEGINGCIRKHKFCTAPPCFFLSVLSDNGGERVLSKGLRDYVCQSVGKDKEDGHEKKKRDKRRCPSAHWYTPVPFLRPALSPSLSPNHRSIEEEEERQSWELLEYY